MIGHPCSFYRPVRLEAARSRVMKANLRGGLGSGGSGLPGGAGGWVGSGWVVAASAHGQDEGAAHGVATDSGSAAGTGPGPDAGTGPGPGAGTDVDAGSEARAGSDTVPAVRPTA